MVSEDIRQPARFGAVITAMATPFLDDGSLDVDGAVTLSRWLVDHGSEGLVVAGTTGEGPVLSDAELTELWRSVVEAVTVPVIAGAGTNDTLHSCRLAAVATEAGADALLVVTPYYNRPSQHGLFSHFQAVASASRLPVLLYDIPVRSGRRIDIDTLVRVAREVPNVVGVKDSTSDPARSAEVVALTPPSFEVYSGEDKMNLPLVAVGAVGVISVAAHWIGRPLGDMISAFVKGDVEQARHLNAALLESYAFESTEAHPNPLPTKAVLRALGLPAGQCRLPMGDAPAALDEQARALLTRLRTQGNAPTGGGTGLG